MSLVSWTAGLLLGLGIAAIIFRSDNKIEELVCDGIFAILVSMAILK